MEYYTRKRFLEELSKVIIQNHNFHIDFIYNNPDLPWDYYSLVIHGFYDLKEDINNKLNILLLHTKIDINFFKENIHKNWNFIHLKNEYHLKDNFTKYLNIDFVKKCINSPKVEEYERFLNFYGSNLDSLFSKLDDFNFDYSILNNLYVYQGCGHYKLNNISSSPKLDMDIVLKNIRYKWDWNSLTLHGNMTLEKADLFLSNNRTRNTFLKYMDNLMIQPWMNSWFIKKHITDTHDRSYYLRRLNNSIEYKTYEKNRVLLEDIISYAMKPERLFYWYLDIYELDVEFQDVLPDDHPRKRKF